MRSESVLVALLVSGCFSDPAYIGEGPASDTGGSGGSSGTSSSGAGGTSSGGTSSGGGGSGAGGEGSGGGGALVPAQGGSGGGAMGTNLAFQSGSCRIFQHHPHAPEFDAMDLATWDADERTFGVGAFHFQFDQNGFMVEASSDGGFREQVAYDATGTPTSLTYWFNGGEDPRESWDQSNQYDDFGRLVTQMLAYRDGERSETNGFAYSDGPPAVILQQMVAPVGTVRIRYDFAYEHGRPISLEITQGGMITDRHRAWYDDAGRLLETEWDSGPIGISGVDGEADFHEQWIYDDAHRIIRYESDFNSGGEYPSTVNGMPDEVYEFEPECADIAVLPYYLYAIPSWLFPYAKTGGWTF